MYMNNFIWTNHALQRLKDRKITESFASNTLESPDESFENTDGTIKLRKKLENQTATAIIKTNDKGDNIILSFWLDPPNPGTRDFKGKQRYKEMKKASFLRKFWLTLLNQVGL